MGSYLLNSAGECGIPSHLGVFVYVRQWWRGDSSEKKGRVDRTSQGKSFYRRCGNGRMSESSHSHLHFSHNDWSAHFLLLWAEGFVPVCSRKGEEIYHQLRRLGASLDWSRACFTLDPVRLQSVHHLLYQLENVYLKPVFVRIRQCYMLYYDKKYCCRNLREFMEIE